MKDYQDYVLVMSAGILSIISTVNLYRLLANTAFTFGILIETFPCLTLASSYFYLTA